MKTSNHLKNLLVAQLLAAYKAAPPNEHCVLTAVVFDAARSGGRASFEPEDLSHSRDEALAVIQSLKAQGWLKSEHTEDATGVIHVDVVDEIRLLVCALGHELEAGAMREGRSVAAV